MNTDRISALTDKVLDNIELSPAEAQELVAVEDFELAQLFAAASRIRDHFRGREVRCCSIAAPKVGQCSEDCAFCSQSSHYTTHVTDLITLSDDEILQAARQAEASGAEAFGLVNSGLGPTDEEIDALAPVVQRLRAETNMRVCASLGILSPQQAHKLARMGVERYNHNLQTSAHHYKNICHTHSYADRLATLTHLREAGIKVCSGALFGMGETWTDRIELAIELRKHDPAIVPVNFLIPIAGTPLADVTPMTPMECLKAIALYRFMLPKQQITVAGGREVNLRDLQSWVFLAGADGFLVGNYLTTCGRDSQQDQNMLRDLNLTIASSPRPTSIDEPTASKSHAS